ncbi:hypothetical protein [Pollutibacter soli]|uniref:hypothetical protein n=1 Tax=Pollutibacter soli TaxID=3034157 RepID=UPI0030133409
MEKTGIINRIHKGLRTWLFETGIIIQETDFSSTQEGMKSVTLLKKVLNVTDRKSTIDETHVLPVLVLHAPYMVSLMDAEIQRVNGISERLSGYISSYMQPGTEAYHAATGFSIQQVYSEFMGSVLIYMNRLETLISEFYHAITAADMTELMDAAQMMHIDGANRMIIEEWIYKGMSKAEISGWLSDERKLSGNWIKKGLNRLFADVITSHEHATPGMKIEAA